MARTAKIAFNIAVCVRERKWMNGGVNYLIPTYSRWMEKKRIPSREVIGISGKGRHTVSGRQQYKTIEKYTEDM